MKAAVNAWSIEAGTSFEEMFSQVKEAGFDGIELNLDAVGHSEHSLTFDTTQQELEEIRALSQQYDLPVVSISTSMLGGLMGSPQTEEREQAHRIIERQLQLAHTLGATGILVVPGGAVEQGSFPKAYAACEATLRPLLPLALEYDLTIGVENVWNGFFMSPFDMAKFIDRMDSPHLTAYYDVGNVIAFSWSELWIDVLGQRISHIHVKDFKRNGGLHSGGRFSGLQQGDVNWKAVIPALRNAGFEGYLTAEVFYEDMAQPELTYPEFYKLLADEIKTIVTY